MPLLEELSVKFTPIARTGALASNRMPSSTGARSGSMRISGTWSSGNRLIGTGSAALLVVTVHRGPPQRGPVRRRQHMPVWLGALTQPEVLSGGRQSGVGGWHRRSVRGGAASVILMREQGFYPHDSGFNPRRRELPKNARMNAKVGPRPRSGATFVHESAQAPHGFDTSPVKFSSSIAMSKRSSSAAASSTTASESSSGMVPNSGVSRQIEGGGAVLDSQRPDQDVDDLTQRAIDPHALPHHSIESDEHFGRCRMAEEGRRTGGQAVGAGLEDDNQVADLGAGQLVSSPSRSSGVHRHPTTVCRDVGRDVIRLPIASG